jgi:aminopeptidase N
MRSPHRRLRRGRRLGATVAIVAAAGFALSGCSGASVPALRTTPATTTSTAPATSPATTVADPAPSATSTPGDTGFHAGAPGLGDPYFPLEGNGGYDVSHYDLALSYDPAAHHLAGTVTVTATATQNLSRFDLDLTGMTVSTVTVGGAKAAFTRSGPELQITPAHGLVRESSFVVAVTYAGTPKTIEKSPIVFGSAYGWIYTSDGAFVGDEPNGASTWFPSNDHPSDKATFSFEITVPSDRKVVANGDLVAQKPGPKNTNGATTTFDWNETSPMATYLATIGIGRWTFATSRTPGGITQLVAYDPSLAGQVAARKNAELTAQVTDYWATKFGPYPFTSTGAIIDNVPYVGFSLETQTRPLYGFAPDPETLSHELAHQWFGDSVSVQTWRDIWLNEGFATFAANLWAEHTGGPSTWVAAQQTFARTQATSRFWNQAIADPQRDTMFSQSVYVRGGLTLAALRHRIGDTKFFDLLQQWTAAHRFGNATTAQFIALANQVSGQDLSHFFQVWLYTKARPTSLSAR